MAKCLPQCTILRMMQKRSGLDPRRLPGSWREPCIYPEDPHFIVNLNMLSADLIGSIAACLSTASFVPQVIQSYRTRDVSGISLGMYSLLTLGIALWLVYGLLTGAWPIIIANGVTLALALSILVLKVRAVSPFRESRNQAAPA